MDLEQLDDSAMIPDDMLCSVCNAEFLDFEDLKLHILQVHLTEARKRRFCKICTQIFPDIEAFALHIRNEHICDYKCCKYCSRLFSDTNELQKHESKHNTTSLYPKMSCSQCKTVCFNKIELENHEITEHSDSSDGLIIRDCFSMLSSLVNMNFRRFLEASNANVEYICAVCDMTTSDISIYIQHLLDENHRSLSCDQCYNVYTIKSRLSAHMLGHIQDNSQKAFKKQCHKCKQFVDSTILKSHLEKCVQMRCVSCDMTFKSINLYTHHMTKHTRKIPLEVCIYCYRQMVGPKAMEKHIERTHKHEIHLYKYHCTDCDRLFKHPKFLFAHFYTKHKDLHPYTCKICDKKFRMRKGFTLHIKLDHKSVGFVEFDDNFHVFFTDKKSEKQSNCQDVLEEAVTNNENDQTCIDKESMLETSLAETNTEKNDNDLSKLGQVDTSAIEINSEMNENLEASEHNNEKPCSEIEEDVVEIVNRYESNERDLKLKDKPVKRKRPCKVRQKSNKRRKILKPDNIESDASSEDSDTPLITIHKRLKLRSNNRKIFGTPWNKVLKNSKKLKTKKFVCTKCKRNCYTYQNFERHKAMHAKNETKVCIKCNGKFKSVKELNEHIKSEHSTSKLTETLKKMLEKRRNNETTKTNSNTDAEDTIIRNNYYTVIEDTIEGRELSTSEKFRQTVKRVPMDIMNTKVTITPVDKDIISVKKYLENFMPDSNEVKLNVVPHKLSIDNSGVLRRPMIKLTKVAQEPEITMPVKLRMPIKFTDDTNEKYDVSIRLVQNPAPPTMNFDNLIINQYDEPINFDDGYDYDTVIDTRMDTIPDVAQEVYLMGSEEPCKVLHTMSVKDFRACDAVAIAHLSSQEPFYKISKVQTFTGNEGEQLNVREDAVEDEPPKDITLPNGTKLVSVNPLAHLMDKETISQVLKARKPKYPYYKPKLQNITETITKAMAKLERPKRVLKRKAR